MKPPPVPTPVPVPVVALPKTPVTMAAVVPALVPAAAKALDLAAAAMRRYAMPPQAGKLLIIPAPAGAGAVAAAQNDDSASGVGRFVDLTADDGQSAAHQGNHFFRKAHVSYGVGAERLKCHCGALIKPKHVRIRITDTRSTTVSFYYHSWCQSSLSFRQHQIPFEKISGREKLTPEDREQLRLNYLLVV